MPTSRQNLPLDVPRAELLEFTSRVISEAWSSFDSARATETPITANLLELARLPLGESSTPALQALEEAAAALDASLTQSRPRFFAFVGSSGLEVGVLGDALASCFDVNLAVTARAADLIEAQSLEWVAQLLGYPFGGGTVTSGGMVSNLTALMAARERAIPGVRHTGFAGRQVAMYCSSEAHYSVRRAAEVLGIGADWVRSLPLDANRRMRAVDLARAIDADIAAGIVPIAVVATAGTTLTGAVDPIGLLADVCAARNVWLHVDGAYGLPAACVPEAREIFAGLERADSLSVDAHKWLFLPKACGVVLVRDRASLAAAFSHHENYMLHEDADPNTGAEEVLNPVDMTLEYSRPFRALKLWLALRVHGAEQYRAAIAQNLEQAQLCARLVRAHDDLELLVEPQLSTVPFRHVPKSLRGDEAAINHHNLSLVKRMQEDGRVFVSSAVVDGQICLRPCFVNFRTSDEDVQALIDLTLELGAS
jgi:aromatic-L-amino-acid/L-tryptophan decarboxylase